MHDRDCVAFLQRVLPILGLKWAGYRKVRRQVCRRIASRMDVLGLPDAAAYETYLRSNEDEYGVFSSLCRVTISRFWRDRGMWDALGRSVLPSLAQRAYRDGENKLRALCIGSASGEEPYTLSILWRAVVAPNLDFPIDLSITALELDGELIRRANEGVYARSSLKNIPPDLLELAFEKRDDEYMLRPEYREGVEFVRHDITKGLPEGRLHLVFCRNLMFTYFDLERQREMLEHIQERLAPGGVLAIGVHESIPEGVKGFGPARGAACLYVFLDSEPPRD
jgi:chemotaxis protein methyltransferase CheR